MRFYRVPSLLIRDGTGYRPARIAYFAGGRSSTAFRDPDTGTVHRAVFETQGWSSGPGGPAADRDHRWPVDFHRPVSPGRDARLRRGGGPTVWKAGPPRRTATTRG